MCIRDSYSTGTHMTSIRRAPSLGCLLERRRSCDHFFVPRRPRGPSPKGGDCPRHWPLAGLRKICLYTWTPSFLRHGARSDPDDPSALRVSPTDRQTDRHRAISLKSEVSTTHQFKAYFFFLSNQPIKPKHMQNTKLSTATSSNNRRSLEWRMKKRARP